MQYREVKFPTVTYVQHAEVLAEYAHNEPVPDGTWVEFSMSDCPLGCKVYENRETSERIVMHNSNYGCRR